MTALLTREQYEIALQTRRDCQSKLAAHKHELGQLLHDQTCDQALLDDLETAIAGYEDRYEKYYRDEARYEKCYQEYEKCE